MNIIEGLEETFLEVKSVKREMFENVISVEFGAAICDNLDLEEASEIKDLPFPGVQSLGF